jgi:hypothetical protein
MKPVILDVDVPPGVTLRTVEAVPLEGFFEWAAGVVGAVGPEAEVGAHETETGWPMFLTRTATGGLAALYRFQEYAAAVIVDPMPGPLDAETLHGLRALLARARPDWRGDEAVSLAEMWDP